MTSWTDYQDDISDAISDSMDVDWSANVGAQAVVAWLNEHRPISAAPAPEGGADREQIARCIIGPRLPVPATSRFSLSDLRDVRWEAASPEDRADALSAADAIIALATREEAPAEAGEDEANHDCLAKRRTGEPMFILLGRDPDAHRIVQLWADRRLAAGGDPDHCRLGYDTAERMEAYAKDPANRPASAPQDDEYPELRAQPQARPGKVTWHSSGEDEGPDVGLQLDLGHGRSLWLGEGQNPTGWQFSLLHGDDIIPVADVIDHEQARDLFEIIASAVQPQVREDAQPVAWKFRHVGQRRVGVTMDRKEAEQKAASGWEVEPLGPITHPAPDARVREALSALVIADDHRPRGLGTPSDWIRNSYAPAIALARQALAALQAEQKGGA